MTYDSASVVVSTYVNGKGAAHADRRPSSTSDARVATDAVSRDVAPRLFSSPPRSVAALLAASRAASVFLLLGRASFGVGELRARRRARTRPRSSAPARAGRPRPPPRSFLGSLLRRASPARASIGPPERGGSALPGSRRPVSTEASRGQRQSQRRLPKRDPGAPRARLNRRPPRRRRARGISRGIAARAGSDADDSRWRRTTGGRRISSRGTSALVAV